ncbi:MAG: hypothetical protein ABR600_03115 [Actinomycetota bacterium]
MTRRIAVLISASVVATLLTAALPAQAQSGGGCQLDGTASFKPGLTNDAADFSYSFNGKLSNCMSNVDGAPQSGTVSAGEIVTIRGQKFQEPVPTGNGSCGTGTTHGTTIITWADGTFTVITYDTTSAAAGVVLQGNVDPSVALKAVKPKKGQPKSTKIKSTAYAGAGAVGLLTFQPPDPTACGADGVKTAAISGFTGIGSQ